MIYTNRETKYRVFDIETKLMFHCDNKVIDHEWVGWSFDQYIDGCAGNRPMLFYSQWTELKDNKRTKEYPEGQDIFEGDIVEGVVYFQNSIDPDNCNSISIRGIVTYLEGYYHIKDKEKNVCPFYYPDYSINVIGNIYENPELVK